MFSFHPCDVCGTASHTADCTSPYAVSARARKKEEEGRTAEQKQQLADYKKRVRTYLPREKIRELLKGPTID